ncbi:MAG: hypothetical protein AAF226_04980, partial [Verrucomicrobiota bacterium]
MDQIESIITMRDEAQERVITAQEAIAAAQASLDVDEKLVSSLTQLLVDLGFESSTPAEEETS